MTQPRIALSLVIHNHQPVGNFGSVFEDNHRLAYQPLLEALERHPSVRVGLHYTGPLMEWLKAERPESVALIRHLAQRDQVEILGGGYYEPVLASLPGRDRLGQLRRMADEVEATFGRRPRGAWLAERVWEPDLPVSLVDAGYAYTVLDDTHLRAAAIPDEHHWGIYSTDDQGRRLLVFGTEEGLRYHIPFRPVEAVIEHLRRHATEAGDRVGMMGDDGEKFGAWPGTWELCWGREAWIERFFQALEEEAGWLTTLRPVDAIDRFRPMGRVYVPTGSYVEMGEWSLPLEQRREFGRLMREATNEGRPEVRWLRGGFWRTFQVTYSEIGQLHKQMLRASAAVDAVVGDGNGDEAKRAAILDHLYRGQSNDCYWHGLFGGIYLSHMRLATASHLIAAEDGARRLAVAEGGSAGQVARAGAGDDGKPSTALADIDLDGIAEVLCHAPGQTLSIKPDEGGGILGWDILPVRHALASVMRRRPEVYHDTLVAHEAGDARLAGQGNLSVDESVRVTEEGLSRRLWYDGYERRSGLLRVLPQGADVDALEAGADVEAGDFLSAPFEVLEAEAGRVVLERLGSVSLPGAARLPIRARKTIELVGDRRSPGLRLALELKNEGTETLAARLGLEWSLNLLGGGGNPQAYLEAGGERRRFDGKGVVPGVDEIRMGNEWVGIDVHVRPSPPADAWWYSIETISLSEQGFERNHQGTCLLCSWPIRLEPGASTRVSVDVAIETAVDRAEEEGL